MSRRSAQTDLFENETNAEQRADQRSGKAPRKKAKSIHAKRPDRFGGDQRKSRASRRARPVSTKASMHLVLKSMLAKGAWSFLNPANKKLIRELLMDFANRNGIQILSSVNMGNHLHIHLKTKSPVAFKSFLRGFSGAVALKITGASKIKKLNERFWTQSPFTRFVHGIVDYMRLKDYFDINRVERFGVSRRRAELFIGEVSRIRQRFRKLTAV